jgi:hypothetical protein
MIQCRKCGQWFAPTITLTDLCPACLLTPITVSAGTISLLSPHDKLLALGWKKMVGTKLAIYYNKEDIALIIWKIDKAFAVFGYGNCSIDLHLAKILVEYLEKLK